QEGGLPYLFYYATSGKSYKLPYDLFSAVFYLLTDYEKYVEAHYDRYGRYEPTAYPSRDWQLADRPLVHLYCEQLWGLLIEAFGEAALPKRKARKFETQFTFDIDFPWKYRYKGFKVAAGGMFKDLVKGEWGRFAERLKTHISRRDPNDTFALIYQHFSPEQTRFFFLIDRTSVHDSRFTYEHPQYGALIREIAAKGYEIGVHPSFESYLDYNVLAHEQWALSQLTGQEIRRSRQHFLRYRLPETYRHLIKLGIREEYSSCLFQTGGFPSGMALPYPWFDLLANQETELMIQPTHLMDRTLQQYLDLNPEAAAERYTAIRDATREVGGQFRVLLHNDVLSESEEWRGWRDLVLQWAVES
ncbi:MAG: polysaccharide deacetylase family protein, partial [Bacteroidota bacterium]